MAVSETIQELLEGIDSAQYGRDMRQFIHKGIQKCYEEGSAGETDLEARDRLDVVEEITANINKWYMIPCDTLEEANGITAYAYAIINPVLKLLDLSIDIINRNVGMTSDVVVYNLPLLTSNKLTSEGRASRRIASAGYVQNTSTQVWQRTASMIEIYGSNDSGGTSGTLTNSRVEYTTLGSTGTSQEELHTHILVPYKSLAPAHPFSEAVLIEN